MPRNTFLLITFVSRHNAVSVATSWAIRSRSLMRKPSSAGLSRLRDRFGGELGPARSVTGPWGPPAVPRLERHLFRARTGEGRKRAQERGVRFGRPHKLTQHQRREALDRLRAGDTHADIARTFAVSRSTISRLRVD